MPALAMTTLSVQFGGLTEAFSKGCTANLLYLVYLAVVLANLESSWGTEENLHRRRSGSVIMVFCIRTRGRGFDSRPRSHRAKRRNVDAKHSGETAVPNWAKLHQERSFGPSCSKTTLSRKIAKKKNAIRSIGPKAFVC
ncbi:uncharacterized protein LOC125941244 [Dermacentor silvarum]|uniref:uncharacterized protein LOC125941244 n=1 Tax=Dermacentor silvarum TaxID=543639 RepID=UPI0021016FC7|nr:uncharacterized protein LOC125941244 [Dermacentor silvarum]